jgi:hypothetical protein
MVVAVDRDFVLPVVFAEHRRQRALARIFYTYENTAHIHSPLLPMGFAERHSLIYSVELIA